MARGANFAHQFKTGIGNQRRSGVRDQGDVVPGRQPSNQLSRLALLAMLMETGRASGESEALQQVTRVTRVLGGNQRHLAKDPQGAG